VRKTVAGSCDMRIVELLRLRRYQEVTKQNRHTKGPVGCDERHRCIATWSSTYWLWHVRSVSQFPTPK